MKKCIPFCTVACSLLLSSCLFLFPSRAEWVAAEDTGGFRYQNEDGSFAAEQWIDEGRNRYYIREDGLMAANQCLTIDGSCFAFYGDGRLMHNSDITDVELGYLNLYSSADTICTAASKWGNYILELPGNTAFLDYRSLTGRSSVYEFLASVPGSGTRPLTISSSYFQMEGSLENYASCLTERMEEANYVLLSSQSVVLGNEETYEKLSFVYDPDGVYGRPLYKDCFIRKIDDFCPVLSFEYESLGTSLAKKIQDSVLSYR